MGIGDWGLGPIPNPQSTIPKLPILSYFNINLSLKLKFFFDLNNVLKKMKYLDLLLVSILRIILQFI